MWNGQSVDVASATVVSREYVLCAMILGANPFTVATLPEVGAEDLSPSYCPCIRFNVVITGEGEAIYLRGLLPPRCLAYINKNVLTTMFRHSERSPGLPGPHTCTQMSLGPNHVYLADRDRSGSVSESIQRVYRETSHIHHCPLGIDAILHSG